MRPDGQRRTMGSASNQALYLFFTSPLCPSPCDYKRERSSSGGQLKIEVWRRRINESDKIKIDA
jgi:hypothetical protein